VARAVNAIKAVHDADLVRVLRRLGLYDALAGGRLRCAICGRPLSLDNLGGIYRDGNGDVKLVCNRMECLVKAAEEVRAHRHR
jgi:hypothetical protein